MKSYEIRQAFLDYFKRQGHEPIKSSSLVPHGDATLMFTNAGMNQFKDCFLGADVRSYSRAVTSQKVMRIAGKHNDFENVGVTARHHTFFEMLGNFSFGDYFKKEAIQYGWDFVTKVLGISPSRLWVTVFEKDDEAEQLWQSVAGVKKERIVRLGEAENFWSMGETGPCGPCTEMHVFCGADQKFNTAEVLAKGDGNFLEIWNLVFMQFDRSASGVLTPLPKPSVDTGMGLERVTSVMQGARSNYDTDLLRPIIARCEKLSGYRYEGSRFENPLHGVDTQYHQDVAMRVIADHSRAMSFIIADGVLPGSEGRAYILRRIIRRAIRHGRVLEFKEPFLKHTCREVIQLMSAVYPELQERADTIERVVDAEERKFHETLDSGLSILRREVEKLSAGQPFSGKVAFQLHDTYGFPLDLTEDALKRYNLRVDVAEFDREMSEQKRRSRDDRKGQAISYQAVKISSPETKFVGYETTAARSKVTQVVGTSGNHISLLFEETPFYAESGGQVGDTGAITFSDVFLKVQDTQKLQDRFFVHHCTVEAGTWSDSLIGTTADLCVDEARRSQVRAHHSATHLLHWALRTVLGVHVKQAGSRVSSEVLRFDFSHFEPISDLQLREVQSLMNHQIRGNYPVETKEMGVDEAMKSGAMALFGEKYGTKVRVVRIGPHSLELCGGTHVTRSGDIGFALISGESGVAAGVRRVECVVSEAAERLVVDRDKDLQQIAEMLKGDSIGLADKVSRIFEKNKALEREVERLNTKLASSQAGDIAQTARATPQGIKVICKKVDTSDPQALRSMVDKLRQSLGSGVVALGAQQGDKAVIVTGVTSDLTASIDAGKLIREASKDAGGRGGGKADFAQAGGVNASQLDATLEKIFQLIA